jgi:hypothetical protein
MVGDVDPFEGRHVFVSHFMGKAKMAGTGSSCAPSRSFDEQETRWIDSELLCDFLNNQ